MLRDHATRDIPRAERPPAFVYMMIKPLGLEPPVYRDINDLIETQGIVAVRQHLFVEAELIETHYEGIKYLKDGSIAPHFKPITGYLVGRYCQGLIVQDTQGREPSTFVKDMRKLVGKSNPLDTEFGQIRHLALEYALPYHQVRCEGEGSNSYCRDNLVHCSDSFEAAIREVNIWMPESIRSDYQDIFLEWQKFLQ